MSKKIISIILTIAMILCQGTLCLGTVSAASSEYIVEPDFIELSLEASDWAPSFVTLENDASGNLVFIDEGHKNDGKERYDTGWMELKNLDIPAGNYFSIELVAKVDEAYPARRYNGDIWTSGNDTRPQFYYGGTMPNGAAMNFTEGNSTAEKMGKYIVSGSSTSGYYGTKFETYTCELSGSWADMETLTKLRLDANKNSTGKVTIKSIKLIGRPGIKSIGFNSAYDADIDAMPVDPDTIDITLAGSFNSIDGAVSVTDPDGNEVSIAGASLAGNKVVIALADGAEFEEFTTYTVTINENAKVTANKNLREPISFSFTTDDSKAPSIFDTIDPGRPSDFTTENVIWSAEFKSNSDLDYFKSGKGLATSIVYDEYLSYKSDTPTINANKNLNGYYTDTGFDANPIDANLVNKLQIRMKIVNAVLDGKITGTVNGEYVEKDRAKPTLQLYYKGIKDDGSTFNMGSANAYSANYTMKVDDEGRHCTDWFVFELNLNTRDAWVAASQITAMRFDFANNCEAEVLVDYVRLIGPAMPEIEEVKYNSDVAIDEVQGMPVNPETVDLYLTEPVFEMDTDAVIFEDEYGNSVDIKNVVLGNDGKKVTIFLDQELDIDRIYFIGINENAKIGPSAYVDTPVVAECYVGNYRALSPIEIIDPGRPSDEILPGEEIRSLDFKTSDDLKYFKSKAEVKTSIKYNEYMEYKTESMGIGATSGLPASYYIDSDFASAPIDANKHYRLQIRMKIDEQTMKGSSDGHFKLYFKGDNGVNMSESNCDPYYYTFRTDADGKYGTDWFTFEIDLTSSEHWKKASQITGMRFDFLKNAAGTVLVDYIRFIAMPTVTELSYTTASGDNVVVEDGVYVPADAKFINLKFSQQLPGKNFKFAFKDEFENVAQLDMNETTYAADTNTFSMRIGADLEKDVTYTIKLVATTNLNSTDLATEQWLYKDIVVTFKTEPSNVKADVVKGVNSSNVAYANMSDDTVVFVAVATIWNGNTFVSKNIVATTVAPNDTANEVVNHAVAAGETAEVVVMQYHPALDSYTMISKVVY